MSHDKSIINQGRRQFLRGTGGFTLALPFLPSLAGQKAFAADPAYVAPKRFVGIATDHGNVLGQYMYPANTTLRRTHAGTTGHLMRQGALGVYQPSYGRVESSPVLSASSGAYNAKLAGKMNVLRGLDIPFWLGHHSGGFLGNFAANNFGPPGLVHVPTIDQVMAWSPAVYKGFTPRMRSIAPCPLSPAPISYGRQNPSSPTSNVVAMDVHSNPSALFERLFGAPAPATRASVVDRVLQNYNSIRQSNTRLSKGDMGRLEAHMTYLSELQNRLYNDSSAARIRDSGAPIALTCSKPPTHSAATTWEAEASIAERLNTCNRIISVAFSCDATRVATVGLGDGVLLPGFTGDYHRDVVHSDNQTLVVQNTRLQFEQMFLNLITQMDAVDEGSGRTLLDNSLVVWTQEAGQDTHENISAPVVTAGSAGGYLKTGNYCDYRNWNSNWKVPREAHRPTERTEYTGITHRRWLATALLAMGLEPSEFQQPGVGGYGITYNAKESYVTYDMSSDSDPLPFLR